MELPSLRSSSCSRCLRSLPSHHNPSVRSLSTATQPSSPSSPPNLSTSQAPRAPTKPPLKITTSLLHRYTQTPPPNSSALQSASRFFTAGQPRFLFSCPTFRSFPISSAPEVAFLGRSNVGKSSLLNALFGRRKAELALVSKKAGKTKTMNVYEVGGEGGGMREVGQIPGKGGGEHEKGKRKREAWIGKGGLVVVDCPGYGKGSRGEWGEEVVKYLCGRKQLRRAFLLVDAQHGLKNSDRQLLDILHHSGIPHQIILSKVDTITNNKRLIGEGEGQTLNPIQIERLEEKLGKLKSVHEQTAAEISKRPTTLQDIISSSTEMVVGIEGHNRLGIDVIRWTALSAAGLI
ncbi:MAG: hypothetical protein M1820_000306 [Bogoriella megaspora]|nr:MAG: hypothetical protein M1820_000306 [Bogoriella megaspora]